MSNIYIQEPPTSGKILLKTTVGDIDIELWAKECPKACKNFVQLCMEGYYNGTIFHRVVKGFIVQGGDPNGNGSGGESIYGAPFKDEFHSRLRYIRRGLVGMANSDKDDNGSQFFFTMASTPELQNKNTVFGKVTGDTVYNMLKLEEAIVDHNERPMYPNKIIKVDILHNPFDDIVPREIKKDKKKEKKVKEKGVKNFGLLSFGEEAEEDEQETTSFVQKNIAGKSKSTHDILDDPKLSKEVLKVKNNSIDDIKSDLEDDFNEFEEKEHVSEQTERIKNKLKLLKNRKELKNKKKEDSDSDSGEDYLKTIESEKKTARNKQADEIRQEILSLKKNYKVDQKKRETVVDKIEKIEEKEESNELVKEYNSEKEKYSNLKGNIPRKGATREQFTLSLLNKFKTKLDSIKDKTTEKQIDSVKDADIESDIQTDNWLSHTLQFETQSSVLAKDASTKSDDWYDVYDPRNPINKRKRNETRDSSKKHRI